jgi:hypothetical protein
MPLNSDSRRCECGQLRDSRRVRYYAANRLPALKWFTTADDATKEAALRAACRELDQDFDWTGSAVDDVQALCWPRAGMTSRNGFAIPTSGPSSIPVQLKNAQCEFALQLGAAIDWVTTIRSKRASRSLRLGRWS